MMMIPVSSSQISAIGYDPDTKKLRIQFADRTKRNDVVVPGQLYEYDSVPPEAHAALMAADADEKLSVGTHFGLLIRAGGYAYRRIIEDEAAEAANEEGIAG